MPQAIAPAAAMAPGILAALAQLLDELGPAVLH